MSDDRMTWKCRNGDCLADLIQRKKDLDVALKRTIEKMDEAIKALKPFAEQVASIDNAMMNVSTRLNIWWNEFNGAKKHRHGES